MKKLINEQDFLTLSPEKLVEIINPYIAQGKSVKEFIKSNTNISYDRFTKKILQKFKYNKITKNYELRGKEFEKLEEKSETKEKEKTQIVSNTIENKVNITTLENSYFEEIKKMNPEEKNLWIINKNAKILVQPRHIKTTNINDILSERLDAAMENPTFQNFSRADLINFALNEFFFKYNMIT